MSHLPAAEHKLPTMKLNWYEMTVTPELGTKNINKSNNE